MKSLENKNFQELSLEESQGVYGGGLIVFAFIAGLAVAYYEAHKND